MIVRIETARVYVSVDSSGRKRRRFSRRAAYRDAAAAKVRERCSCEAAEFDDHGRCTFGGYACRLHEDRYRLGRIITRLAAVYERADALRMFDQGGE